MNWGDTTETTHGTGGATPEVAGAKPGRGWQILVGIGSDQGAFGGGRGS